MSPDKVFAGRPRQRGQAQAGDVQIFAGLCSGEHFRAGEDRFAGDEVRARESHPAVALGCDRHLGEDYVHAAGFQGAEELSKGHLDELGPNPEPLGQGVGESGFNAHDNARPGLGVEGRLVPRHAHPENSGLMDPVEHRRRRVDVIGDGRGGRAPEARDQQSDQGERGERSQPGNSGPKHCGLLL